MNDPNADPKFMMGKKKTTIQLPQSVAHWISPDRIATQVSDTYQELTQGKPRGEIAAGK
jgi:hypothetical protein